MKASAVLSLLLPIFLLTACVPHQQYRNDYEHCASAEPEENCQLNAIQDYKNPASPDQEYLLTFVEFDDQGQLWDRDQQRQVIEKIASDAANQDLLVVVFVHGWKHNAAVGDDNIATFRKTLKRLSAMETVISKHTGSARKVVGIYLGWRGSSVSLPVVKELSFWDRKNTAHKVGYGGVTEFLSNLELLKKTKQKIACEDDKTSGTRLVVVGHSFGGALVYSALSEILENGFVQTHGPEGVVGDTIGFADLVVLINPAFEAMRFSSLSDMSTERSTYFAYQLPVLAVLTSEDDNATKLAFPAGRWLSTLFEKERQIERYNPVLKQAERISQGMANVNAVGHFNDYKTHYLKASAPMSDRLDDVFNLAAEIETFRTASDNWREDHPGSKIFFNGSVLERTKNSAGRNPYLNIRVDGELIPNHVDIDDPRIESFIRQLILISSKQESSAIEGGNSRCH